ncbi:leucine-rich repeat domain-containing protein [Phormidium sp. CLA17]|uniref:leucine-rich repeat domain-containing protein n=1 Tax=Leptolyngbya sp. Cla-17 TaxID=2803751 RepID=UPI00149149AA|nr:COR domain-containing protein [Leptolyngbya sp. Cla-17]MBM0742777.1 leucine-rich repeat domain-containing protein [Leptolyngbya sp. Cla-17]
MARDEAYREASHRIEAARQEGATKLYLSNMELTEVPEAIASLTQLQTLHLSNNQLTEVPRAIASLTQLQKLDLSDNQLTEVPRAIASLTQLQTLHLSDNQLTEVPRAIASLTQLQTLDLSGNQLTELPEEIKNLTQLSYLQLGYNRLTSLPEGIAELRQLHTLVIGGNQFIELPEILRRLIQLEKLYLWKNNLTVIPQWISELRSLKHLAIHSNRIEEVPDSFKELQKLKSLSLGMAGLGGNPLTQLPSFVQQLKELEILEAVDCELNVLPDWIGELKELKKIDLTANYLTELPTSLSQLPQLEELSLNDNSLNPDLAAAYEQGIEAVMQYLRARAEGEVTLNEAKLILVGEGEVGKSCLLGALRGDAWVDSRPTTHGIEIKPVIVTAPDSGTEITLNGWDFGGQRVYRPTHQLFFSAPAVYLVVWKPREGPQQGFVKEWITLIKHREPDAKVLVVATHGGPGQRQPDIDRQELLDLFGSDTVVDFFYVDSKPNEENPNCTGIAALREAIANISATLPGMGRSVPTKWQHIREQLEASGKTHLPYSEVIALCEAQGLEGFAAELFVRVSHTLGYLIHYHYDSTLRDIVILKPDWLAKAISFVLDDKITRRRNGLVEFDYLSQLWSHPPFAGEEGYPKALHPVFLRLMERFDLSYKVVLDPAAPSSTSLIAQLVRDNRPEQLPNWDEQPGAGDRQQVQICRIVDDRGQLANAEGLFYQLIVRLHKYSLGRANYENSIHWQRGLMLDNDYNGRALLEQVGTDVKITVRAAYPERFLSYLTEEIKWLVENPNNPFGWKGLRCNVMVSCIEPCGMNTLGHGLFEVQKLIESKKKDRHEFPCPISGCDEWQNIDQLLYNAPMSQPALNEKLTDVQATLQLIRKELQVKDQRDQLRYQDLTTKQLATISRVDQQFADLMQMLTDEAKEGPRLFSFKPVDPGFFDRPKWMSAKFQLTLWCEHSVKPLTALNEEGSKQGIIELTLSREWLAKATPFLKILFKTLSLVAPVAVSATQLVMDDPTYAGIKEELDLGQKSLDFASKGGDPILDWQAKSDAPKWESDEAIRAQGSMLRELHALLKEEDPGFGGLMRVQTKRREFLWVHPQFVGEY